MKKSSIAVLFALAIFSVNALAAAHPDLDNFDAPCTSVDYFEIDAAKSFVS